MLTLGSEECQALLKIFWERSVTGLAMCSEDGRFLAANPAYCRMLEYTESELKNRRFQDVTDPDDLAADVEMARTVAAGVNEGYDMTKAYYTKTKKNLPVLLRVTGLWMSGKFIYFVAEIAPLEKAIDRAAAARPRHDRFLKAVKEYWIQILFALGAVADVADRVINHK